MLAAKYDAVSKQTLLGGLAMQEYKSVDLLTARNCLMSVLKVRSLSCSTDWFIPRK